MRETNPSRLGVDQPLYKVKLLEALRSGDPALIQPFLDEISRARAGQIDGSEDYNMGAAALHLAIRCASGQYILSRVAS